MPIRPPHLLLAIAFVAAACSFDRQSSEEPAAVESSAPAAAETAPAKPAKDPLLVRVRPLARGPIERRLEATANVQSLDVVEVVSERAEPVDQVMVEEGQVVTAGQVLATLRADQVRLALREADVRVSETQTAMEQADRDFQRNLRLYEEGGAAGRLIAEQTVETSRQAWEIAKTAHAAAQVLRERAAWEETRCTLRAPIAGTVTQRDISLGDMVAVGQRAFEITDLSRPRVVFHRPQRELSLLLGGQGLIATTEALPGVRVRGRIERVSPVVDAATGTVKVTALLEPEGQVLPVGMLMRLEVLIERREDALLLPKEALLYETQGLAVFVARDGVARRVALTAGLEDAVHVEVPADAGLQEGDAIIVVGADRLADGDPIEVAAE